MAWGAASAALPQILADELDADWEQVKVRFVTGKAAYKIAFRQEPPVPFPGVAATGAPWNVRCYNA